MQLTRPWLTTVMQQLVQPNMMAKVAESYQNRKSLTQGHVVRWTLGLNCKPYEKHEESRTLVDGLIKELFRALLLNHLSVLAEMSSVAIHSSANSKHSLQSLLS